MTTAAKIKPEPSGYQSKPLVRVLQAAALAMSNESDRPALCGLSYVEDKHRLIVEASNGYLCLRVELQRFGDPLDRKRERRRIPARLIKLAIETLKAGDFIADIPEECTEAEGDFPFPEIDAVFPDVSLVPSTVRVCSWHPVYVEMLGRIAKRLKASAVKVQWTADGESPMRADFGAADEGISATFVLMPMRS
jgi:hypothetical protein